jgi:hypothetical protein
MGGRRIATVALSGALLVGGAGAAIAAVTKDEGSRAEQAVLDSAAKKLDVTPDKLRDALAAAQDEQLDAQVKAGNLTQKQADAIKAARKRSGHVLGIGPGLRGPGGGPRLHLRGFGGPGPGGPGGPGHHVRARVLDGLAAALGMTDAKLREQLRAGKTIAGIAKANGRSLDDVRAKLKAQTKAKLDKAVSDKDLTQAQADRILEGFDARFDALASGRPMRLHRGFRGGPPPAGAPKPGAFMPGAADAPALPDGVTI